MFSVRFDSRDDAQNNKRQKVAVTRQAEGVQLNSALQRRTKKRKMWSGSSALFPSSCPPLVVIPNLLLLQRVAGPFSFDMFSVEGVCVVYAHGCVRMLRVALA